MRVLWSQFLARRVVFQLHSRDTTFICRATFFIGQTCFQELIGGLSTARFFMLSYINRVYAYIAVVGFYYISNHDIFFKSYQINRINHAFFLFFIWVLDMLQFRDGKETGQTSVATRWRSHARVPFVKAHGKITKNINHTGTSWKPSSVYPVRFPAFFFDSRLFCGGGG